MGRPETGSRQSGQQLLKVPRGSEWVALALYQDMVANDEKLRKSQAVVESKRAMAAALQKQIEDDEERRKGQREEELEVVSQLRRDFEKYKEDVAREIQERRDKHTKQRLIWEEQVSVSTDGGGRS